MPYIFLLFPNGRRLLAPSIHALVKEVRIERVIHTFMIIEIISVQTDFLASLRLELFVISSALEDSRGHLLLFLFKCIHSSFLWIHVCPLCKKCRYRRGSLTPHVPISRLLMLLYFNDWTVPFLPISPASQCSICLLAYLLRCSCSSCVILILILYIPCFPLYCSIVLWIRPPSWR